MYVIECLRQKVHSRDKLELQNPLVPGAFNRCKRNASRFCVTICHFTVNLVIFPGGEISRKCWQDISHWGNFHDSTPISFIKAYGCYFCVGVIFTKKTKVRKARKLPPHENFHIEGQKLTILRIDLYRNCIKMCD